MRRFEGRSILVTGGGSGIGEATSKRFASEGGHVMIGDLDMTGAERVVEEIRAAGGVAQCVHADTTNEDAVKAMIAAACKANGPLRHAFNNVGTMRMGTEETMTLEDWNWTIAVSLTSTFLCMKHELPVMVAAGGGTIVNAASISGLTITMAASPAYSAAKAGVLNMTHCASFSYAEKNIRLNCVSPGMTATPLIMREIPEEMRNEFVRTQHVIQRMVKPEEISNAVVFLSSDEAEMITGRNLEVSGGRR